MTSAAQDILAPRIRRRGGGVQYGAGSPIKVGPVQSYDQAVKLLGTLARKVASGELEVETGAKMSAMVMNIVRTIHYRRSSDLEERRLDLLGAAAEEGAAVFQGVAIIPPSRSNLSPSLKQDTAAPQVIEAAPAIKIQTPNTRGTPKGKWRGKKK